MYAMSSAPDKVEICPVFLEKLCPQYRQQLEITSSSASASEAIRLNAKSSSCSFEWNKLNQEDPEVLSILSKPEIDSLDRLRIVDV